MPVKPFRPMLATDVDFNKISFPVLASPKLDGIRAVVRDGVVYSRSNKPIPNRHTQQRFAHIEHYDGELIVGKPTSKSVYRDTVSGVMSEDGQPNVNFHAFDYIEYMDEPYEVRARKIKKVPGVVKLTQTLIKNLDELLVLETEALTIGYEGLILRDPKAPYKQGRSTVKEGYLLKVKRFIDAEAVVIGFEERMRNENEAVINELGRTKRSSHQSGKSGRGDLGALLVRLESGIEFALGTGFDDLERAAIWNDRNHYIGKRAKFKYFNVGVKVAPRHPVFLGWRDEGDM